MILGPAEQALESTREPETRQKLHLIRSNTDRLYTLVNQLLDLSRLESGAMKLLVSRNEAVQFLRRTVMSFESWAERKKIDLAFQSGVESYTGFFDTDKMEKILNNLLSNALKFTPEGSVNVSLKAPNDNGDLIITVADTGSGISPDNLPHIFERFYRADESHAIEGTGIGLALTENSWNAIHGTITAESSEGQGSVFTVTIPGERSAYTQEEISESSPEGKERKPLESAPLLSAYPLRDAHTPGPGRRWSLSWRTMPT